MATTKSDIVDFDIKVPKGTKGVIVGVQWGDKKDGFVIDFPHASRVYVPRECVVLTEVTNASEESRTQEKKRKSGKQEREEELQTQTVGKGSEFFT